MRRQLDRWPSEVSQYSVPRRVQAAEDRKSHMRTLRTSEMLSDPSAKPSGDRNRDESGPGEMQVEDHVLRASAQGVQRFAETVLRRDCDTRARSSSEPLPASGMDVHSIVTNEQREERIQSVLKLLKEPRGGFDMVRIESKFRDRLDNDESE